MTKVGYLIMVALTRLATRAADVVFEEAGKS